MRPGRSLTRRSLDIQLYGSDEPAVRVDQLERADDRNGLAGQVAVVDLRQDLLLQLIVEGRAGILIVDLVGELLELDGTSGIAKIGAVDRRAGLNANHQRAWNTLD